MAQQTADILSMWRADELGFPRPGILIDHPGGIYLDLSETPTVNIPNDPSQVVCRYTIDETVMDAIEADPNYSFMLGTRGPVAQQASQDEIPGQEEYVQWRNRIANMKNPDNPEYPGGPSIWQTGQLIQAIGTGVDGRTRRELNQAMTDYTATAPRFDPGTRLFLTLSRGDTTVTYTGHSAE